MRRYGQRGQANLFNKELERDRKEPEKIQLQIVIFSVGTKEHLGKPREEQRKGPLKVLL